MKKNVLLLLSLGCLLVYGATTVTITVNEKHLAGLNTLYQRTNAQRVEQGLVALQFGQFIQNIFDERAEWLCGQERLVRTAKIAEKFDKASEQIKASLEDQLKGVADPK